MHFVSTSTISVFTFPERDVDFGTLAISVLGGIGTGVIGLIGLHLQHRFTANTEQISSTLAEIEAMTERCADTAVQAWSEVGSPESPAGMATISQLHAIGEFIEFIAVRVPTSRMRLTSPLLNFRRAATDDDFDVRDRPPKPERSVEIHSSAASLRIALRSVDFDRRSLHLPFISH